MAALQPLQADNPFRDLASRSTEAVTHHINHQNELHGVLNLNDWLTSTMRQSIDDTTSRLQSGLSILASVGSTAPFIGLFGTVWGIYHALIGIGAAGQATLDKVAGPVGESLVMTAGGLAVAIPAVLGYNALVRGNKEILARLKHFAHDLHAYPGDRRQGAQEPGQRPSPAGPKGSAMSFQASDFDDDGEVMSEINMTPLVDVMLVLLIIFIITVPVINHAVKLDLPKASSQKEEIKPTKISLVIDALSWNGESVPLEGLDARMEAWLCSRSLSCQVDKRAEYDHVAQLLSAASHMAGQGGLRTTPPGTAAPTGG
jgi:biopolymer transport protein ExbB/TolQ/biopolymer transport protein ExbD